MDKAWLITNLEDARHALDRAISEIKQHEAAEEHIAQQVVGEVYAKLNYAWNSRAAVPAPPDRAHYDEWIRYPKVMDIYVGGDDKSTA